MDALLQDSTNVGVRCFYSQGHSCTGDRMCVSTGMADKRSLAAEEAKSNVGFQLRDFPGPFEALVRRPRTQAAGLSVGGGKSRMAEVCLGRGRRPVLESLCPRQE